MKFDPQIHHRKSIRLKGYDYSVGGFVPPTCYAAGTTPAAQTGGRLLHYDRHIVTGVSVWGGSGRRDAG